MKYFSTFSGIGGFELGIKKAHERLRTQDKKKKNKGTGNPKGQSRKRTDIGADGFTCVGYSEIDKHAIKIYQSHFPSHKNYGDITTIRTKELPDFELLVGGFPCQSFSIAGKRKGFNDTRGTLFFEIARILDSKRPRLLLLENVKGLLSHDGGRTFSTILATLDELGYDTQWQVLNSKNFGVPQNRERIFIVGNLRGTPRPEVFPIAENNPAHIQLQGHTANTLTARYEGAQSNGTYVSESKFNAQRIVQLNQPIHSNDRIYSPEGISPTLNTMQGGQRQPFVALSGNETDSGKKTHAARMRTAPGISRSVDEVSDSQKYKCLGNAVTVNVVEAIIRKLINQNHE